MLLLCKSPPHSESQYGLIGAVQFSGARGWMSNVMLHMGREAEDVGGLMMPAAQSLSPLSAPEAVLSGKERQGRHSKVKLLL